MGYILKNTSGLINTRITDTGRLKISQGNFNIAYFQIGDSEVSYSVLPQSSYNQYNSFVLEPSFNAQNSSGIPQSNKENIKYPYYVDESAGNTYGIPFMASVVEPVYNRASPRGFFTGLSVNDTISWSANTNNSHVINANYIVDMSSLIGDNTIDVTYNACNENAVRPIQIGDIVTIFFDGKALYDCACVTATTTTTTAAPTTTTTTNPCVTPLPLVTTTTTTCSFVNPCCPQPAVNCTVDVNSCFSILTYRVTNVCNNLLTLDRNTPDFSYLNSGCFARVLVYPPTITEIYDSVTPSNHWSNNVINYESICYTDEFDVKIWNMNIPWSETPAGIDPLNFKDYTQFGSINYLGSKEYFGYASSSGQTDTSSVYYYNSFDEKITVKPEEQKAIAIVHYTNQTVDLFYGEKFALEPLDETAEDTTGQARNFKIDLPWLMWHKNSDCCNGQSFYVDPPGFEDLGLFKPFFLESTKNIDMNDPGIRYYHLWDTNANTDGYPSRVGKVFPDSKTIVFDDEEIIAAMSYKSNRNWTLPAPKVSLVTPNVCGVDNGSAEGILTGSSQYMYVTYRLSNTELFTNSLHCNYYQLIQGPNISCIPATSQNVALRFGTEFPCLNEPVTTTTTTTSQQCPCWYSGLTLITQFEGGIDIGIPFLPTGQFLNGYPIFYAPFSNAFVNLYWDGLQWVLINTSQQLSLLSFATEEPIGNFEFFDGEQTGFTVCDVYEVLIVEKCLAPGECNVENHFPLFVGGVFTGYANSESIIYYSSGDWILEEFSIQEASFTGLTINEVPVGNWILDGSAYISVTSYLFDDYYTQGCQCYNISALTPSTVYSYIDCYNVIISGDTNQTDLCIRTITTLEPTTFPLIFEITDFVAASLCGTVCTTTTTIPVCAGPVTTTTTICPTLCDIQTGFYANKFEVLCQVVSGNTRPDPDEWRVIDFTSQLTPYLVGGYITEDALTASTFVITQELYDTALLYDLSDYIDLTPVGFTGQQLNFGDEYYFYGNVETDIQATIYEMVYKISLGQAEFQTPSNPTWSTSNNRYITEIGLYDQDKNLMIISKLQSPVSRQGIQQFLIKLDL
jgi:hypothetical protein